MQRTLPESKRSKNFETFYAFSLAWQLGFLIAVPLAAFIGIGIWLDSKFNTQPLLTLLGLLVGLSVTIYEVYHVMDPLIRNDKKDA